MYNIAIAAECVADIPLSLVTEKEVEILFFDVQTEKGLFRDHDEVDAGNIVEYMMDGKHIAKSVIPSANDYKNFYKHLLEEYDEIIHISVGSKVSEAINNARLGRTKLGIDHYKVHLLDSKQMSSGMGMLVLEAIECRKAGLNSKQIMEVLHKKIPCIRTSFICNNADYLYYNGHVSGHVMKICRFFNAHPVLEMVDGNLVLRKFYVGDYKRCVLKYVKSSLKDAERILRDKAFFTYVGCSYELLQTVKEYVAKKVSFDRLWEQQASATISCNCGPMTFSIIYAVEEEDS